MEAPLCVCVCVFLRKYKYVCVCCVKEHALVVVVSGLGVAESTNEMDSYLLSKYRIISSSSFQHAHATAVKPSLPLMSKSAPASSMRHLTRCVCFFLTLKMREVSPFCLRCCEGARIHSSRVCVCVFWCVCVSECVCACVRIIARQITIALQTLTNLWVTSIRVGTFDARIHIGSVSNQDSNVI